jgi:hypothetical protein
MRIAVLVLGLLAAGCSVGEFGPDATSSAACVDRVTPPIAAHIHTDDNTTHAGRGCVTAACHLVGATGAAAPAYQFGGTVYKLDGTTPSAGVTIRIRAPSGMVATGVTDDAGNFRIPAGALPDPFPAVVNATACPTVASMVATLSQGGGDCNNASCHGGATPRIFVAD